MMIMRPAASNNQPKKPFGVFFFSFFGESSEGYTHTHTHTNKPELYSASFSVCVCVLQQQVDLFLLAES